eukprot:PhF_6_TR19015/c0_g1_i2/m.27880
MIVRLFLTSWHLPLRIPTETLPLQLLVKQRKEENQFHQSIQLPHCQTFAPVIQGNTINNQMSVQNRLGKEKKVKSIVGRNSRKHLKKCVFVKMSKPIQKWNGLISKHFNFFEKNMCLHE